MNRRALLLLPALLVLAACNTSRLGASPGTKDPPVTPETLGLIATLRGADQYGQRELSFKPSPTRALYGVFALFEAPDGRRSLPLIMMVPYGFGPGGKYQRASTGIILNPWDIPILLPGEKGSFRVYVWDGDTWYVSEAGYRTPLVPFGAPTKYNPPGDWFDLVLDPLPPFRPLPAGEAFLPPERKNPPPGADEKAFAKENTLAVADRFLSPESPLFLVQSFCTPNGFPDVTNPYGFLTGLTSGPLFTRWTFSNSSRTDGHGAPLKYKGKSQTVGFASQASYLSVSPYDNHGLGDTAYYLYLGPDTRVNPPHRYPMTGGWWLVRNKYPLPGATDGTCPKLGLDHWEWYFLGYENPFGDKTPDQMYQEGSVTPYTWDNLPGLNRAQRIQWGP